jgi:hypothetical protein
MNSDSLLGVTHFHGPAGHCYLVESSPQIVGSFGSPEGVEFAAMVSAE